MSDAECPYCGADIHICHDDGYGYEEDEKHEQECSSCEKIFVFETTISFSYETFKADCLNGAPHKYEMTTTSPPNFARIRCSDCGEEKHLVSNPRKLEGLPDQGASLLRYLAKQESHQPVEVVCIEHQQEEDPDAGPYVFLYEKASDKTFVLGSWLEDGKPVGWECSFILNGRKNTTL